MLHKTPLEVPRYAQLAPKILALPSAIRKFPVLIFSQYILPPKSTVFIGCVGEDKYAQIHRERNDAAGLRAEYLTSTTHPTGRCGVVDEATRTSG